MDRHNQLHRSARVELPASVQQPDAASELESRFRPGRVWPKHSALLGLVSFLGGGVAVIVTASMLAMYVQ